ncbi:hypothetical protein COLO4_01091 [Corchorus olitorius]|uniref:Uncharacterized protein n=1 Tax=Corchorus olitorius TaxID=93759 RepID=A0A1R3L361_9ROSI|nr:hypothetical protein COLO4_01091 [Corchorus olitorius]
MVGSVAGRQGLDLVAAILHGHQPHTGLLRRRAVREGRHAANDLMQIGPLFVHGQALVGRQHAHEDFLGGILDIGRALEVPRQHALQRLAPAGVETAGMATGLSRGVVALHGRHGTADVEVVRWRGNGGGIWSTVQTAEPAIVSRTILIIVSSRPQKRGAEAPP